MTARSIDLNADVGEIPEALADGRENALVCAVSSANIAAGGHAGNEHSIRALIDCCLAHDTSIGVHPSYPDRAGFGRTSIAMSRHALLGTLIEQIERVRSLADVAGAVVAHLKPHGALYHDVSRDAAIACVLRDAIVRTDPSLRVVLPPTLATGAIFEEAGIAITLEGFVDRAYTPDGMLVERSEPGALILDPERAASQAVRLAGEGVRGVRIDTLCVHSDTPGALAISRSVRAALEAGGYVIGS